MSQWNDFPKAGWNRSVRHEELIAKLSGGARLTCYYVEGGLFSWLVSRTEGGEITGSRATGREMVYAEPEVAARMWEAAQACQVKN